MKITKINVGTHEEFKSILTRKILKYDLLWYLNWYPTCKVSLTLKNLVVLLNLKRRICWQGIWIAQSTIFNYGLGILSFQKKRSKVSTTSPQLLLNTKNISPIFFTLQKKEIKHLTLSSLFKLFCSFGLCIRASWCFEVQKKTILL
jgi:hypothetical protein